MNLEVCEMHRRSATIFLTIVFLSTCGVGERKYSNHKYNTSSLLEIISKPEKLNKSNIKIPQNRNSEPRHFVDLEESARADDFPLDEIDTETYPGTDYSGFVEDSVDEEDFIDTSSPENTRNKPNFQPIEIPFKFENFVTQRYELDSVHSSKGYEVTTLPFKDTKIEGNISAYQVTSNNFVSSKDINEPNFEALRSSGPYKISYPYYNEDRLLPPTDFRKNVGVHYSYNIKHVKNNHRPEVYKKENGGRVLIQVYRGHNRWHNGKSYAPWGYFIAQPSA